VTAPLTDPSQLFERPSIILLGERVALGPLRRDLVALYAEWMNDFAVTRTLGRIQRPFTLEDEEAWYNGASQSYLERHFTIYERTTWRPIGTTGLFDLDFIHRTAEFGVLIGARDCWGRGYGTETTVLVLDYAFNAVGLHNVVLRVFDDNERGLRAYLRAGFKLIGRRRQANRIGQQARDVLYLDALASDFQQPSRLPQADQPTG
jgi:RimJ/RimL family protein N-acetyltransferase